MDMKRSSRRLALFLGRSAKRGWPRVAGAIALTLAPVMLFTGVADAAGDPSVARYIISKPVPWAPWPAGSNLVVSALRKDFAPPLALGLAADSWLSSSGNLDVALIVLSHSIPANTNGVENGCNELVHAGAVTVTPIPGVPNSEVGVCAKKDHNFTVVEAEWIRGATLVVVEGIGLSEAAVNAICRHQDAFLPPTGIHLSAASTTTAAPTTTLATPTTAVPSTPIRAVPATSSNSTLVGAVVLAVVVALVVVVVVLLVQRSRRAKSSSPTAPWTGGGLSPAGGTGAWQGDAPAVVSPAPVAAVVMPEQAAAASGQQAPPGWHPISGDPHHVGYWDGSRWTAQRRWDGQAWVDAAEGDKNVN
jgi:hypothetical protein